MRRAHLGVLMLAALPAFAAEPLRLVTVNPGHFHAALIQKEALPDLAHHAFVYAPLGPDLTAHLNRVAQFNLRKDDPTRWSLSVYAGADYWQKLLDDRPGDLIVFSGASQGKIDRVSEVIQRRLHTLVDKPWIIEPEDFPKLQAALDAAGREGVIAFDGMTQRYEISLILQRALVNDEAVFGKPLPGSASQPSVYFESVHYLLKTVAGVPNLRPVWFFDVRQQGEGLTDVGTHLVDLVSWILFPDQAIECQRDIRVLDGSRWPTILTPEQFQRVTSERQFPPYLSNTVRADGLHYFANNSVLYTIRGVHTKLDVKWDFEAAPGASDTELSIFSGSKSKVEVRQGKEEKFRPEVFVVPVAGNKTAVVDGVKRYLDALHKDWPELALEDQGERLHIVIPDKYRIGHEAHFALLVSQFLRYVRNPRSLPAWEKPNMLSKYFVTTQGVELARRKGPR